MEVESTSSSMNLINLKNQLFETYGVSQTLYFQTSRLKMEDQFRLSKELKSNIQSDNPFIFKNVKIQFTSLLVHHQQSILANKFFEKFPFPKNTLQNFTIDIMITMQNEYTSLAMKNLFLSLIIEQNMSLESYIFRAGRECPQDEKQFEYTFWLYFKRVQNLELPKLRKITLKLKDIKLNRPSDKKFQAFLFQDMLAKKTPLIQNISISFKACLLDELQVSQMLSSLMSICQRLKSFKLNLAYAHGFTLEKALDNNRIMKMINLNELMLDLSDQVISKVTTSFLVNFIQNSPKLNKLKISLEVCNLSDDLTGQILEAAFNVTNIHLNLSKNPISNPLISKRLLHTQSLGLNLSHNPLFDSIGFTKQMHQNISLNCLLKLDLSFQNNIIKQCEEFVFFIKFIQERKFLRQLKLNFQNCRMIDSQISQVIDAVCKLKYLLVLELRLLINQTASLTQNSIKQFKNLQNLIEFNFYSDRCSETLSLNSIPHLFFILKLKNKYLNHCNIVDLLLQKRRVVRQLQEYKIKLKKTSFYSKYDIQNFFY